MRPTQGKTDVDQEAADPLETAAQDHQGVIGDRHDAPVTVPNERCEGCALEPHESCFQHGIGHGATLMLAC
jgi:hypothetical protein